MNSANFHFVFGIKLLSDQVIAGRLIILFALF